MFTNVILCGGSGTRLFPLSRSTNPKQFIKINGKKSLFQETVERNREMVDDILVVANEEHYFLAIDDLDEIKVNKVNYLLESIAKNTAAAIAMSCFLVEDNDILLVVPSDHIIKDTDKYKIAVEEAKALAEKNFLVTFGIKPDYPETGFGYIKANGFDVVRFIEKPDLKEAEKFLQQQNYFWNSGMFCFKAKILLSELKKYSPDIYDTAFKAVEQRKKNPMTRVVEELMNKIPSQSIDYAVMEKSSIVKVVQCDIGWSDVGSFDSLYKELPINEEGNTLNRMHISTNSKNNLIIGEDRLIATVDVEDLIIVNSKDTLLVAKKGSSQNVKTIVENLKVSKPELYYTDSIGRRPWGTYTVLEDSVGYKIKRIEVKPEKRLSLQKHMHRNEHWVVVSGRATVTVNDKTFILNQNESTYIKAGEVHRLLNDTNEPLIIIEVQVGDYTGEDDIIRLDDDFSRN